MTHIVRAGLSPLGRVDLLPASDCTDLAVVDGAHRQSRPPINAIAFAREVDMLGDGLFADPQYLADLPIGFAAHYPIDAVALALRQPCLAGIAFGGEPRNPASRLEGKAAEQLRGHEILPRQGNACFGNERAGSRRLAGDMGWHRIAFAETISAAAVENILEPRRHPDQRIDFVPGKADIGAIAGQKYGIVPKQLLFEISGRPISGIVVQEQQQIVGLVRIGMVNQCKVSEAKRPGRALQQVMQVGLARNLLILRDQSSQFHFWLCHQHHHVWNRLRNWLKYSV
jgi:hypothetical protein